MSRHWEIVRLAEAQAEAAAALINRAFVEQPLGRYAFPDPRERHRLLPSLFALLCRFNCLFGEPYTTAGVPFGVALAGGPGTDPPDPPLPEMWQRAGVERAKEVLGAEAWGRHWVVLDFMDHSKIRNMPEQYHQPCWYVSLLAVDPDYQGQGIGSALLQAVIRHADAAGLPCALDTMLARNVGFFQQHGFQVLNEDAEPKSGIRFWTLWREPSVRM